MEIRLDFDHLPSNVLWCWLSLSWRPVFLQAFCVPSSPPGPHPQTGNRGHPAEGVSVHPGMAVCAAVIITNTRPYASQQMKSCYYIVSALSLLCATRAPACHLFRLIFLRWDLKKSPSESPPLPYLHFFPLCARREKKLKIWIVNELI